MRLIATLGLLIALSPAAQAQQTQVLGNPTQAANQQENQSVYSYGIGYNIGMNLANGGLSEKDITQADLLKGFLDALAKKDPQFKPEQVQQAMMALDKMITDRKKAVAQKFLNENKSKDGVQTTETGLQYKVLKKGSGATPQQTSVVTVHYEGKLVDGTIFDSSIKREQPAEFPVNRVIPGWTEALMRMKVGDKWQLFIPPELAYGAQGSPGGGIGPYEALVFEVELLGIKQQ